MKALVVVDVQKDFLPGGALAVKGGDGILPVLNKLLDHSFDVIVATKDWHPTNHSSFASTHRKEPGTVIEIEGLKQMLWPDHCIQGTDGAEFGPGWNPKRVERVFYKGTDPTIDSYSTFFDNAHRRSTGLGGYLKERGVDEVYLVGLATDYCVKYSALDALELGFKTFVIEDACMGIDSQKGDVKRALSDLEKAGVEIIQSQEILK